MTWLDVALVAVTIGTAVIIVSPLARMLGLYAPTDLVEGGFVLGLFGRPTWRFWALHSFFLALNSASHFEKGEVLLGAAWALMTPVFLVFLVRAARQARRDSGEPPADGGSAP